MKKATTCFLLILFLTSLVFAARVFGSLKYQDRSVGEGVRVLIHCEGEKAFETRTDAYGSYSAYVKGSKRCKLFVNFENQWSEAEVIYPDDTDPVRYDFELVRRDNKLFLKRR